MRLSPFLTERYSEESQMVSEGEHDEVLAMIGAEADAFTGYGEWSAELESENFVVVNGRLQHKPEPASRMRRGGFEL